ncbi:transposase family protein, partial [Pontibacillus halophilus]|uniref:transposase family protein n=1 Tax=Pontibacillus halophilus TaxID=516704 RepID=UPI001378A946
MYVYSNIPIPGLQSVIIKKSEEIGGDFHLYVEVPKKSHKCKSCGEWTQRIHDYRTQKIQHLKLFERTTYLFYRKRRY